MACRDNRIALDASDDDEDEPPMYDLLILDEGCEQPGCASFCQDILLICNEWFATCRTQSRFLRLHTILYTWCLRLLIVAPASGTQAHRLHAATRSRTPRPSSTRP